MNERANSRQSVSEELERRYRKARDPVLRTHLQIVWRLSLGGSTREVAESVGYSERWVREIAKRHERGGVEALGDGRHTNPGARRRALLDERGREELAEALQKPPRDGGMWNSRKVARWIEEKTGRKVHPQRGWEYLRRAGHTPQLPRPASAGADPQEREAFKKGSPSV
jgi:transposase